METTIINATEYRNMPLALLTESTTNPRKLFDEASLKELAESIRVHGILSPLLVRPLNERSFEIVAGARRYRAAQLAEIETAPVRIVNLTDAEALEAALIENLQRRDVHPLEEAQGFRALLNLDEPKYSVEQIAAKTGKSPAYCASRLKLTELAPVVVEAFSKDEIGVGHALLLAKLQPAQQEQALAACYQEAYGSGSKSKRILLPVRHLQQWIEQNVMLVLKDAPFDGKDAQLVPAAGSCLDCAKRTGHNKLLFAGVVSSNTDACSDPACWSAKLEAHVKKTIAVKPKLVQITTAYGKPAEGSPVVPRNRYVEIRQEKPQNKYQRDAPEFKTCKYTTEAIISEGTDKGEIRKVCVHPDCPVHRPQKQQRRADADAAMKAAQEKQHREEAIANTTGIRVLAAIAEAVPVRLMKRDLLFVAERLAGLVDEQRLEIVARQRGIKWEKGSDSLAKLFASYLRRADEGALGSVLVELTILLTAARHQTAQVLNDAAAVYKVDTDAIAAKVKQEFAAKDKAKAAKKDAPKPPAKPQAKAAKKSAAA
jgi:ParB family chromosome partitioning protein